MLVTFLYMFVFYLLRKCQYSIMIVTAASYLVISFVDNQPDLRLWDGLRRHDTVFVGVLISKFSLRLCSTKLLSPTVKEFGTAV